jgi:hypothetical protein
MDLHLIFTAAEIDCCREYSNASEESADSLYSNSRFFEGIKMTSAIGSSTSVHVPLTAQIKPQQVAAKPVDSDGDHDGSKPGEVEAKATSGSVGTIINTKA